MVHNQISPTAFTLAVCRFLWLKKHIVVPSLKAIPWFLAPALTQVQFSFSFTADRENSNFHPWENTKLLEMSFVTYKAQ